jgi:hypothetical protein
MRNFLATVLSVIAVGVLLIAYGLLSPRVVASDAYPYATSAARPMAVSQQVGDIEDLTPRHTFARAVPVSYVPYDAPARLAPARRIHTAPVRVAARPAGRDWAKTAMVIGGTSAAGAGLGAIFGGKKGALIGAAIGGGAGTLFEVKK